MRLVHTRTLSRHVISGTICDRCGECEHEPPEIGYDDEVVTEAAWNEAIQQVQQPRYVTVTVDHGPEGEFRSGHFCPACDLAVRTEPGAWLPYLRPMAKFREGPRYRIYRFQVRDAETGQLSWIESLQPEEFV